MSAAHDGAGLLGGAMLALGCLPLLARRPAAIRAVFAQAALLAAVLAGRGLAAASWRELAGAAALLAAGAWTLRLRFMPEARDAVPGRGDERTGGWGAVAAGLALVVLGAAAGRQAALLQEASLRDTLGLALPVLLLGLLAASLRHDPAVRGAAMVSALHGVALAALGPAADAVGMGGSGMGAGPVALAVAALSGLLVAAFAVRPAAGTHPAAAGPADGGIGHRA